ncbi:MAG: Holliday junction resolvase RuvX [Chloroflexi bacterium]|nr:MAG: Holliday junction resolvase RuvX [Chloroflexota bacterium]
MRVLALDVGERRIGVAISDPSGTIARPLQTLARGSREEDFAAIAALVAEHGVGLVVVGRPLSLNGTEGPQARRVARYAEALTATLPVPVTAWDERFTTVTAEEILRQTRRKKRRARDKGEVDAVAAAVILQSYLDSQNSGFQDSSGLQDGNG